MTNKNDVPVPEHRVPHSANARPPITSFTSSLSMRVEGAPAVVPGVKRCRSPSLLRVPSPLSKRPALFVITLRLQLEQLIRNAPEGVLASALASTLSKVLDTHASSSLITALNSLVCTVSHASLVSILLWALPTLELKERILLGGELQKLDVFCFRSHPPPTPLSTRTLFEVFSYLSPADLLTSMSRVSTSWYIATMDRRLWSRIHTLKVCRIPPRTALSKLVSLRALDLTGAAAYVDDETFYTLSALPALQHLNMQGCESLTDYAIAATAKLSWSQLRFLCLKYCTGVGELSLKTMAVTCTQLRHLNLNYARIRDQDMELVARGCPLLRTLSLKYCRSVSDGTLRALGESCIQLRSLTVSYCTEVSDDGIAAFASGCIHLEDLDVKYCRFLNDATLRSLSSSCHSLRRLKLNYCDLFTDVGIQELCNGCPELRELQVVGCRRLTDVSVSFVAANCRFLRYLCLDDCVELSDSSVAALISRFPTMPLVTRVELSACPKVSGEALQNLAVAMSVHLDPEEKGCLRLARSSQLSEKQKRSISSLVHLITR